MQLNALFCCLWRNVEASCHKHFVVFSAAINTAAYYQRCVITCETVAVHRRPRLQHLACCSVNTGSQADIGSESWFLPTPPAFDVPVRGFPSEYCYAVWRGKNRMVWLPDGGKNLMMCLFVLTWSTNVTDTRTDGQTDMHDDRACIASRGKDYPPWILCWLWPWFPCSGDLWHVSGNRGRHQGFHKGFFPWKTAPPLENYSTLKFMRPAVAAIIGVPYASSPGKLPSPNKLVTVCALLRAFCLQ